MQHDGDFPFNMENKGITKADLITLTEAAELLELSSFRRVNLLIKKGKLKAYKLGHIEKKFVSRSDIEALLIPQEVTYGNS